MSVSVHFNAYNQKGLTGGVQAHQERFSEKEALHALKNTKSHIDPSETKYNVSLYRDEVLETKTVKRVAKELTDQFQANREKAGLKRKRSDFKTMMVGTFQISDDSLELMGYDKSKKWSENSKDARQNVKATYWRMVKNALNKPDNYGRVMTATMHVDESTPHVDFMSIGVDPERLNFGVREILNGEETKDPETGKRRYMRKGAKLEAIQDDLEASFEDVPERAKAYDLVRGSKKTKNIANAKELRAKRRYMKRYKSYLDDREDSLSDREHKLDEKEKRLTEKELELAGKESEIDSKEVQLDDTKKRLEAEEEALSGLKSDYDALVTTHNDLKNAYHRERWRRIELEATYEFDVNNPDHHYFKKRQLEMRQKQKTPQTPKQQTKNNGYSL
jgi:DNA repair exonuclease SbcCD ATPase subunit